LKTNVSASALVLDSSTNVYVGDTSTLKFGQDGTLLWSQPVNGQILKLDGTGNLYASGKTYQGPTTKLDRNGGVLWTAPFGGLSALGNSGNVYLASAVLIPPGAGYFHNATVKLNNQGGLVWQAINDRGYSGASVSGVALDANENVYLAGYDNNTPTSWKYDPDGLRIWQNDLASGPYSPLLAFDSSGNLYLAVNFGGLQLTKYTQVAAPGAPVIAPPPQHPLVRPGDNVTLAVNATGNAPLNYQWRTLLGLIPDGTNATLLLTNVQSSQAGMYSVAVTNALGSAASPEIYVSVLNPLASQTAVLGATATFFTPLAGGGPAAYQWQFNGANLSGQTRATLAVTNIGPGQAGGYTVVVSNYYGNVLTSTVAQLQVDSHATQAWADIVPGGNVGDVVQAVGVDPLGNVFVTGYSDCGHKTVKYNAAGQELWEACDTNYGTLAGLVVDASGNVCVAGGSFAWKYSPSGNLLWTSHFDDGAGSTNDVTGAMAIDSAGSFYIAGTSASGSNGTDIITAKYSPGGRQIWAARYDGPAHGDDFPESIVVDNAGNVYAGGASLGTNDYDFAVLKYDPNGNLVWARSYNGPGNGADVAARIAVDSSGEVYVTGWSPGDDYITDFATIKYDASGAQLWVARYAGPGNGQDNPHGLAVDTGGNVYVTGSSFGADGFNDIATVKYAPDGTELWVRRYSGPANGNDYSRALALDSAGNVYVEGHSDSGPGSGPSARSTEVVTLSYDSGGTQRWAARYETGIESGNYYRNGSMTVERGGTVYVADTTFTSGSPAFLTLKYVQPIPIRLGLPVISSNGQLRCVLTGEPGALYTIQFSTDLVSWNLLTNVLTTAAGTTEFTDSIAPGPGTKFYRALQP